MLLHSSQAAQAERQPEPKPELKTEAQEQAETLAEDIMGIDESEGDLPLPLYLAGQHLDILVCAITLQAQHSQLHLACWSGLGTFPGPLMPSGHMLTFALWQEKFCGSCRPKRPAQQADLPRLLLMLMDCWVHEQAVVLKQAQRAMRHQWAV